MLIVLRASRFPQLEFMDRKPGRVIPTRGMGSRASFGVPGESQVMTRCMFAGFTSISFNSRFGSFSSRASKRDWFFFCEHQDGLAGRSRNLVLGGRLGYYNCKPLRWAGCKRRFSPDIIGQTPLPVPVSGFMAPVLRG